MKETSAIASLFSVNGSPSRNVKYVLYGIYAALFVIVWHAGAGTTVRPFTEIGSSFYHLWFEKGLAQDLGQSIQLIAIALGASLFATLATTYIATLPALEPISYFISRGRFLGLMGLNAIFIEVFGLGIAMKIAVLTFSVSVFFVTSMHAIITEIPRSRYDYARSLGLNSWQVVWHVVIRGTADQMLESLRQNAAIGWMMITAVEGIVKSGGIGDRLYYSYKHFDRGEVLAIIFCILLIGILMDITLRWLQHIITPHVLAKK